MNKKANWWVFCLLSNYVSRWFSWTLAAVQAYQQDIEPKVMSSSELADIKASEIFNTKECLAFEKECTDRGLASLQEYQEDAAAFVHDKTWDFFWNMTSTYRDMYRIIEPHSSNFLYSYQYIEMERWVYELAGYWGPPGTPPPDATASVPYLPINVPTLLSANCTESYETAYPDGFFQPFTESW